MLGESEDRTQVVSDQLPGAGLGDPHDPAHGPHHEALLSELFWRRVVQVLELGAHGAGQSAESNPDSDASIIGINP